MDSFEDDFKFIIDRSISHILEISEGTFGQHPQWPFYRKVLLKHLNELKRNLGQALEGNGEDYEQLESN